MSNLRNDSGKNRPEYAVRGSTFATFSDCIALPSAEDPSVFESNCTHDQLNQDLSGSNHPVICSPSNPQLDASSGYPQRPVLSQGLSADDVRRYSHTVCAKQTASHQRKSRSFFDRMRTSSNRHTTCESKPYSKTECANWSKNCNLSQQVHLPTLSTNQSINIGERPGSDSKVYRLPTSINKSTLLKASDSDPFYQQKPGYSVLSLLDQPSQNESKYNIDNSSQDDQRQRNHLRDSLYNHFPKLTTRHSGTGNSQNSSQTSLLSRDVHQFQDSEIASQLSLKSPESRPVILVKNIINYNHSENNLHVDSTQTLPPPEPQLLTPSRSSIISQRQADASSIVTMQQAVRESLSSNSNRSSQVYSHRTSNQRDAYNNSQNEHIQSQQPSPAPERDINDNYKELVTKYKKVKGLYFEKTAQVEQLQNTLANQRLSQSRTSLDDSEYIARFQRLEGAITDLAFSIRKDWRTVPKWISMHVNSDAMKVGKQEMIAVGRAVITRFLMDKIFNKTFHPGLPSELSHSLKLIEQNIRKFCPAHNNQEESEALNAKVTQWRLATIDGLKDMLSSPESTENRRTFVCSATEKFTDIITSLLQEPSPPGIKDSANMIIELATSITANLPLESREINIIYPMPGSVMQAATMKLENPIPSLLEPIGKNDENESENDGDRNENTKDKKGYGTLHGIISRRISVKKESSYDNKKGEDTCPLVRFSGFFGVEVRGMQVLYKAPVWNLT